MKWIKTTDKLPEKHEWCLIFHNKPIEISPAIYKCCTKLSYFWIYTNCSSKKLSIDKVSHWMPLSSIPLPEDIT